MPPYADKYPRRQIDDAQVRGLVKNTKVILSFGTRNGGFDMAITLRSKIMAKLGIPESDKTSVYLDAVSLRGAPGEFIGGYDDQGRPWYLNNYWDDYYFGALNQARTMVTLLTKPWLMSHWCWGEFAWIMKLKNNPQRVRDLKIIFVMFQDSEEILNQGFLDVTWKEEGKEYREKQRPRDVWWAIRAMREHVTVKVPGAQRVAVNTTKIGGNDVVKDGFNYVYTCNDSDYDRILTEIKP
jgi:hypothetical protein